MLLLPGSVIDLRVVSLVLVIGFSACWGSIGLHQLFPQSVRIEYLIRASNPTICLIDHNVIYPEYMIFFLPVPPQDPDKKEVFLSLFNAHHMNSSALQSIIMIKTVTCGILPSMARFLNMSGR